MSTHRSELARAVWRASSYSAASGNCVEAADLPGGLCAVRDSKDQGGAALTFTHAGWVAFTAAVKIDQFS
jgi:hypothetical protein